MRLTNVVTFLVTTNAQRAIEFYRERLGFHLIKDDGFALVFDANGTMLRITPMKQFTPAPYTVLGWQVDNIEKAVAELAGVGVKTELFPGLQQEPDGIWEAPDGDKVAWFKDPDGNVLSVSQHVAEAATARAL
jgi:catechol 2,3-dioxygenase-like lactoylglutathione lyase family enzyme